MSTTPSTAEEKDTNGLPLASSPLEGQGCRSQRWVLLCFNCTLVLLGGAGPLLLRVYFLHGGKRMWLSSLVQVGGWPLAIIPLTFCYMRSWLTRRARSGQGDGWFPIAMTFPLAAACAGIGVFTGLDCYMFAFSASYLPVSTAAILSSTQMAFVALFALLIVRQRFTPYSVNAVVLLSLGTVALGSQPGGDRAAGDSKSQYVLGFVMTLAAAALYGFTLPLTELMYIKTRQKISYCLVMEVQVMISLSACAFCIIGMLVNKDFGAIPIEAGEYDLGEAMYYLVLTTGAVSWQVFNLGLLGIISCSSSLLAGIVVALLLPVTEVMAVLLFHEKFDGGKGIALALSLWGFISYWYGDLQHHNRKMQTCEVELPAP
ncbi:hypothetical protein Taro_053649 [Colocasia esculenta]|uniref:Probable purine permease n=1 Tax=Colocasia esculenta TaxID=4460 RepID=A0A843XNR1_COLES|nr:hypothetical protein [Colocasia esculenta]